MSEHITPVMLTDSTGYIALFIVTTAVGAIIGGVAGGYRSYKNGDTFLSGFINGALTGAAIGFALGTGIVFLGPLIAGTAGSSGIYMATYALASSTVVSFAAGFTGYSIEESMNNRDVNVRNAFGHGSIVATESVISFGIGGITGSVGKVGDLNFISKEWGYKQAFIQEFTQPVKYALDRFRYLIFD